ncbi:MAG: nucleoside triphosphate pyrophosphohydrolase [Acidobacteriota bacterium]
MAPDIDKLRQLIVHLRSPKGCPWDREQTLSSVRAYLLEEAHETAAAIDSGDRRELLQELGDLLFQVVFITQLAEEEGAFDLAQTIDAIHHKMVERHPHVFGDDELEDTAAVLRAWELRKTQQSDGAASSNGRSNATGPRARSVLAGIPASLPPLLTAYRMTQKAAGVGFDWPDVGSVMAKIHEELDEVNEVLEDGDPGRQEEEVGDLLFTVVNLARHLEVDPDAALAKANRKFKRRLQAVEAEFERREQRLGDASLDELDDAWNRVKRGEAAS